jgi:hypothetical protein
MVSKLSRILPVMSLLRIDIAQRHQRLLRQHEGHDVGDRIFALGIGEHERRHEEGVVAPEEAARDLDLHHVRAGRKIQPELRCHRIAFGIRRRIEIEPERVRWKGRAVRNGHGLQAAILQPVARQHETRSRTRCGGGTYAPTPAVRQ